MSEPQWELVKVSASSLDRVVRCEASAALPQIVHTDDEDEDDGRARGHAVHRFLERVPEVGRDAALAEVDEKWRPLCDDITLARIAAQLRMSREVILVYNWVEDTARIGEPDDTGRVKIDRTCEIVAKVDVLGESSRERAVYVGDYKTGSGWLPSPEESFQLGLGAVAAARLRRARVAQVEYIRIRDDGTVRKFSSILDLFGLDSAAEKIAATMRRARELRVKIVEDGFIPNVNEGRWCKYCPARQHCPAKTALVRSLLHDPQPIPYVQPLTPEIALTAYNLLKRAKEAIGHVEGVLYAYAKVERIPLGVEEDGSMRYFGELSREGNDVIDGRIAHQVIAARFGGEVANKVVTMEATKKDIKQAVRDHKKPDETQKEVFESIIDEIDELGGVKNPITTTTVEYTVDPAGEAKARKRKAS